jgi:lipid II:glycine glycyltransferase (peptidoglycan interpeptide bridge formation enzyme)
VNAEEKWNQRVYHPLQSWEWGEFRAKRQPISRVNGMLVVWTKVPFTPWYFGYIPMGPALTEENVKSLIRSGKKINAIGIRVEPNIKRAELTNFQFSIFNQYFRPGRNLFKPKTFILDLTKSEEELLKNMHPKGRYNIKVAQKHNVSVRLSVSDKDFEKYLDLMFGGTTKRQKIYAHGRDYHRLMWQSLKEKMAHLFVAEYKNNIIAAAMIFTFRDGIYYAYGASALEHKEVMAPTLLLWQVMLWGKQSKYRFFDLWGAEEGKGFSRFKEQFGGELVELAGTFDLPGNDFLYPLFRLAEEIRWKTIHFLK